MSSNVAFYDLHPKPADMRDEVLDGLSRPRKWIPPKFFDDQRGSRLFDAITELPEYYPTRTEIAILERHGREMADLLGREVLLVELGSGSSLKIRVLLEALNPAVYVPVDISRDHLLASARDLARSFPGLAVHATCADYSLPFELPVAAQGRDMAAFFPRFEHRQLRAGGGRAFSAQGRMPARPRREATGRRGPDQGCRCAPRGL